MVFVGVHGQWGRVDVTQADLGCGQDRESIYKTKTPSPLTCYECEWRLHLVHRTHGAYELWFLCHANNAPHCEAKAAGEGMQHHLLKLDLAHHARAAGWNAESEVPSPDGSWRADVLATSPDGKRRPGSPDGSHRHHRHRGAHRPLPGGRDRSVLVHRPQDRALAGRRALRPGPVLPKLRRSDK